MAWVSSFVVFWVWVSGVGSYGTTVLFTGLLFFLFMFYCPLEHICFLSSFVLCVARLECADTREEAWKALVGERLYEQKGECRLVHTHN